MMAIVGREREIATLQQAFEQALQGSGMLVLISGEAGIGKTTLVRYLVDLARSRQVLVLVGGCYDLSVTPPYGPWLELVEHYRPPDTSLPAAPAVLVNREDTADVRSQEAFFRTWRAFFHDIAARQPLLLVLEDLHWSDRSSLELLRYMARYLEPHPIMIVATYRDDEVTRDHPLFRLLPALTRESRAERVDLRPLNTLDVGKLLTQRYELPESEHKALVELLVVRAEGNPLFTQEILRSLEADGMIQQRGEIWTLESLGNTTVPVLIRQLIDARTAGLDAPMRRAIQLASVIGEVAMLDEWANVAGVEGIERLLNDQTLSLFVIEASRSDSVKFRHALVREAVYDAIPLTERRQYHREIAEALLRTSGPDPDRVAFHLHQARDPRAIEWWIAAGERAERNYGWPEAVQRYAAAAETLKSREGVAAPLPGLLHKLARLLRLSQPARALEYAREAYASALAADDQEMAYYSLFYIGLLECMLGDPRSGITTMQHAVDTLDRFPRDNDRVSRWVLTLLPGRERDEPLHAINGSLSLWLAAMGFYEQSITAAERFLRVDWKSAVTDAHYSHVLNETRENVDGYHGLGISLAGIGRTDESLLAYECASELLRIADYYPLSLLTTYSRLVLLHLPYRTTNSHERRQLTEGMHESWELMTDSWQQGSAWMWELPLFLEGRWPELRDRAKSLPLSAIPISVYRELTLRGRARLALYDGDHDTVSLYVREMFPHGPTAVPGAHFHVCATEVQRVAAEMALLTGNQAEAQSWLSAHDRWLDWNESVLGRADGFLLWARWHLAGGNIDRARDCAEQAMRHATEPEQPLALIAIHRFLGELGGWEGDVGEADSRLQHSLTLAEASAIPHELALTLLVMAELEFRRRNDGEARSLLTKAQEISHQLGAPPIQERAEQLATTFKAPKHVGRSGLSTRELEVLRLLTQGMADKQIADALFISHHTVMRHVSNILDKLGVDSRTAAVAHAIREDLV